MKRLVNVAKAALDPAKRGVLVKKAMKRLTDRHDPKAMEENKAWIKANQRDFAAEAAAQDPVLWKEAQDSAVKLKTRAGRILEEAGVKMGGGGFYPLLYFLVRTRRPKVVVETGVAAGFSSQTILEALDINGDGMLYSSDFPYFRMENPERLIGIVVEERLKSRWQLRIKGDETNLPEIMGAVNTIDLFHYDSDKSLSGRNFAVKLVLPKMAKGGMFIMDDIQDDTYFRDLVQKLGVKTFHVYEFEGKNIGMFEVSNEIGSVAL